MGPKSILSDSKLLVHILVCIFGIASWVDINGAWVELPILVTELPEGWSLPSHVTITSQIANIGPILFALLVYCNKDKRLEKPASAVIIVVGVIACLLLSFFWKETTSVFGQQHATALLSLTFVLSFVDCTSSMAFTAFMACIKPQYLSTFFIGEGLSGMLPSLIALGQGAGSITCVNTSETEANFTNGEWHNETVYSVEPMYETPRFSVQVFFLILSGLVFLSLVSFLLLNFSAYCKQEHVNPSYSLLNEGQKQSVLGGKPGHLTESEENIHKNYQTIVESTSDLSVERDTEYVPRSTYCYLLCVTAVINMQITSFLLSVQSYTSLPYGLSIFHLCATLSNIANPVACFVSLLFPIFNTVAITVLTLLGTGFSCYLILLASTSPSPPLVDTDAGGPLSVTSWAMASFLLTYAKVSIAGRLRCGGRRPMLWYGAFTQVGATVGTVVAFILVNVCKVFRDAPNC